MVLRPYTYTTSSPGSRQHCYGSEDGVFRCFSSSEVRAWHAWQLYASRALASEEMQETLQLVVRCISTSLLSRTAVPLR
jgi:hypothetical protein